ncbi:hypothetical protein TNCV_509561 [Trichonephila clavipes]|nr:hypothetical protein TNCV_509561 [Trichonephila clavipes]
MCSIENYVMQQEVPGVPCSCLCVAEACPPERFPGIPVFSFFVKSAREVPAFRFFPEKDEEDISSVSTCNVKLLETINTASHRMRFHIYTDGSLLDFAQGAGIGVFSHLFPITCRPFDDSL